MQSHAQELVAGTFAFLGSLSEQIAQLCAVLDIMKSKNMDLLILSQAFTHFYKNIISQAFTRKRLMIFLAFDSALSVTQSQKSTCHQTIY